jgi:hypothetical protein
MELWELVYLDDQRGRSERLELLDWGLIVVAMGLEIFDMNQHEQKRCANKRGFRPEPLCV